MVCLPILLLAETGILLLALEPALNERLEGLSSAGCVGWLKELVARLYAASSLSLPFPKKPAFDAVIGVLGVLILRFGGGVSSSESEWGPKALTRAIVGVLNGNKFKGGRRSGTRSFFLKLEDELLDSRVCVPCPTFIPPSVIPRFRRVSLSALVVFSGDFSFDVLPDFSVFSENFCFSGTAGLEEASDSMSKSSGSVGKLSFRGPKYPLVLLPLFLPLLLEL